MRQPVNSPQYPTPTDPHTLNLDRRTNRPKPDIRPGDSPVISYRVSKFISMFRSKILRTPLGFPAGQYTDHCSHKGGNRRGGRLVHPLSRVATVSQGRDCSPSALSPAEIDTLVTDIDTIRGRKGKHDKHTSSRIDMVNTIGVFINLRWPSQPLFSANMSRSLNTICFV